MISRKRLTNEPSRKKGLHAFKRAVLAACFALSTMAAAANAPAIRGELEGEPVTWYLAESGRDTSATFVEHDDILLVDIAGFAEADSQALRDSLALRLHIDMAGQTATLESAALFYFIGDEPTGPVYTAEGQALRVTLERVERDGHGLSLEGELDGELNLSQALMDGAEPLNLDARFALRAREVEF
ncbi:hypothetical protein ACGK9R_10120 [Halomonas sp. HNIBRBA4712]|uniref:hypothetical protein n=1 Tax=Halomonas sp. HNIBRBA4712 TaxID=3373087 RepID=UPI0037457218